MGGNAIKKVPTIRLDRNRYHAYCVDLEKTLNREFPSGDFRVIPAYGDKPDFGDLDMLYAFPDQAGYQSFHDQAAELLRAEQVVKNGDVVSMGVPVSNSEYFQLDFIRSNPCKIHFAEFYFGYNDLGNLMGRIARFLGLKLGHEGLFYVFRPEDNPDHVFREILVSNDVDVVLNLLGFDPEEYHRNDFAQLSDVFEFVMTSRYMMKEIFLSGNHNHITRKREKKRGTYKEFIAYLETLPSDAHVAQYQYEDKKGLRNQVMYNIMQMEVFRRAYLETERAYHRRKEFLKRFDGKRVSEMTGLSGEELGMFIQAFRRGMKRESFEDYVMAMEPEALSDAIMDAYHDFKGSRKSS